MEHNEIIKKLSEKLLDEAIQRTKGTETKKGYDTTGYGYQYAVDRFNDILGELWGFNWKVIHEGQGKYKDKEYNGKTVPGASFWDITIELSIWINNAQNIRTCVGGHTATNYADALKGAITNGFKKTAAFWGVGRDAFAGTIDDDNQPLPDSDANKIKNTFNGKEVPDMDLTPEGKLLLLPENIKEGLRILTNKNSKEAIKICEKNNWDESKINAHMEQNLK